MTQEATLSVQAATLELQLSGVCSQLLHLLPIVIDGLTIDPVQ